MTPTGLVQSQAIALDLHALLRELEPERIAHERQEGFPLQEQLLVLQASLDSLLSQSTAAADDGWSTVKTRLVELNSVLRQDLHRVHTDRSCNARWAELRARLQPVYVELAKSLRSCHLEVPGLRPTNYQRSGVHMLSGAIGVAVVAWLDMATVQWITTIWFAAAWCMEIGRKYSGKINAAIMSILGPIAHPHEYHRINSATWYCTALLLLSLTESPIVCMTGLVALGLGDPCASLVGRRWGKRRLIHNRTLEGTLAFIASSAIGIFLVMVWAWPAWSTGATMAIAAGGAISGGLVELTTQRIDDNLAVPVTSGFTAWCICVLLQIPV
jgi:dolichol kinase